MEILILLAMILANGVFAMSEIAVVSSKKVRLRQMADAGVGGAGKALDLAEEPAHFLSTIQVGITSIGILSGAYGEAALVSRIEPYIAAVPALEPFADEMALAIVVIAITFVSLIFGELVPKRLALLRPEAVAAAVSRPMFWLSRAAAPFVRLLSLTTETVLRLMGMRHRNQPPVTAEEIHGLMREGEEAGIFEEQERALVSRVLLLDERRIPAIMTPRMDIVALDVEDDIKRNLEKVNQTRYTRMPVCRGDLGHVLGILSLPDLLEQALAGRPIELAKLVDPALYVPVTVTVMDLLEHFKRNKAELALVVDEFGEIEGLVTLNDVLEALVGDMPAADEEGEEDVVQREDGSWLIDGSVSLDRLREVLEITAAFPEEATGGYHTLAGLVITALGRIPKVSDHFAWDGFRFEVVDMDRHRVDRILVSRRPEAPVGGPAAAG